MGTQEPCSDPLLQRIPPGRRRRCRRGEEKGSFEDRRAKVVQTLLGSDVGFLDGRHRQKNLDAFSILLAVVSCVLKLEGVQTPSDVQSQAAASKELFQVRPP